jgi:class 3 adenylate cyclase/tetratricopeptide (TPR) repeat protein
MKCPKCKFRNREGARFCKECGTKLELACPKCEAAYTPGSKFCDECGHQLEAKAKIEVREEFGQEGERKHVTVLFSDITGYTAMSEKLDPEEVKAITSQIFGEISKIVGKYDGFIEKYAGDAVMALFGVPRAHEDDSIRAIKVAREIHECVDAINPEIEIKIGQPLSMHSGINSGLVVTGEVDLERGTHGVAGDTINLASRLSNLAEAAEILVGMDTYRQARGSFTFKKLKPRKVKGKDNPLQAYRVVELRTEQNRERSLLIQGISSPLVGRNDEFATAKDCIEHLQNGQGGIVSIIGEAGLGKSRLMAEIYNHTLEANIGLTQQWFEGRCLSYGQTISYWPFQEILYLYAGITENDSETEARQKLESCVTELFTQETAEILPYLASLLTLEVKGEYAERVKYLDGEALGHQIFLSSRRFFERLAQAYPLVLVFEDLQWVDESSALLLEHILSLVERSPLLIFGVSRPDSTTPAAKLREIAAKDYASCYTEIRLGPLSLIDSAQMTRKLLDVDSLTPRVKKMIVDKAEGNPFFLEEIIRSLIDAGAVVRDPASRRWQATAEAETITIPDTIQGVITARVDRLDEDIKRILRSAAVIGRSFPYLVLRTIERENRKLDQQLAELQGIELIREKQREPELEYIFKHALVQEVIYESILLQKRRKLHAQVGQAIEALFADRLEEFYSLLAYHYAQAEVWEKAHDYLMKAGDQAGRVAADAEALAHYEQAITVYERAFGEHWEQLRWASLARKMGQAFFRRGQHQHATEYLHRALAYLGKPLPSTLWGIRQAMATNFQAYALAYQGNFTHALKHCQEIIQFGQEGAETEVWCWGVYPMGFIHRRKGQLQTAITNLEQAIELSEAVPDYLFRVMAGGELGQCYIDEGKWQSALDVLETSEGLCVEHNVKGNTVTPLRNGLAEAYLMAAGQASIGKSERNDWLNKAGRACKAALKQGKIFRPALPEVMLLKGRYEYLKGRKDSALKWWQSSLKLAEEMGQRYDLAMTHLEIYRWLNERKHLEQAEGIFAEIGTEKN